MFQLKYLIAGFYWTISPPGRPRRNASARVSRRLKMVVCVCFGTLRTRSLFTSSL